MKCDFKILTFTCVIIEMEIFKKKNPHEREISWIFPALGQSTGIVKFSYLRCPTNTLRILS